MQELFLRTISDPKHAAEATDYLLTMAKSSKLIRALLGEHLNNPDYRYRIAAMSLLEKCNLFIGQDLVGRLLQVITDDWHQEVRLYAGGMLCRMELQDRVLAGLPLRLQHACEAVRLEVLTWY